jgi:hypothetical protein
VIFFIIGDCLTEVITRVGLTVYHKNLPIDRHKFIYKIKKIEGELRFMVFNATFSNISVLSWRSVLLVE